MNKIDTKKVILVHVEKIRKNIYYKTYLLYNVFFYGYNHEKVLKNIIFMVTMLFLFKERLFLCL